MRVSPITNVAILTIGLAGCSELQPRIDVNKGSILGIPHSYEYSASGASNYYKTKIKDAADPKLERNRIIFELLGIIDDNYARYELALRSDRAYKDIGVKILSLALTGAATISGSSHALAALDTGLKGGSEAVDTAAFRNQTPELLINRMRASRSAIAEQIYVRMNDEESRYPIEAARTDLNRYYNAGSVTAALASLAASTAIEASSAASSAEGTKLKIAAAPPATAASLAEGPKKSP